jgi:mercury(II) reductase
MTESCCASANTKAPDLAVIGAGSAGFAAAIRAAELGAQVALIGHGTIGGTCVNVGCVPSKTLIRAAETLHQGKAASRFAGISGQAKVSNWRSLVAQKDELVGALRQAKYIDLLPSYNTIAYMEGPARFTHDGVAVNGHALRPRKVIVATGARPSIPAIEGLDKVAYLTSTSALELDMLPKSLAIIGGGVVAVELGQLFVRAGVHVTMLCRSRVLSHAEPEISGALESYLRDEGLDIRCSIGIDRVAATPTGIAVSISEASGKAGTVIADKVLVATGRTPNTQGLGLDEAGIALTERGGIRVDDRLRTTRSGVYAAGDVTGRDMFVYMAAHGAKLAAENALNGDSRRYDSLAMPEVVFADPQAASVGLTEAAAHERGMDVRSAVIPLDYVPRAIAARDTRGLIKLVAERRTGALVGAHMLAPEAGDSIQTAALAIKHRLTVQELADTIFPYLTTVEGLKLAAQAFDKDVAKLSCCAG